MGFIVSIPSLIYHLVVCSLALLVDDEEEKEHTNNCSTYYNKGPPRKANSNRVRKLRLIVPISTAQSIHISIQVPVIFEVKQSGVWIFCNKILDISRTVFRQKPWDTEMSAKTFGSWNLLEFVFFSSLLAKSSGKKLKMADTLREFPCTTDPLRGLLKKSLVLDVNSSSRLSTV